MCKGDVQSCTNYRGIKLMSHTMKIWERVVEARLRQEVDICEQQYGFMPRNPVLVPLDVHLGGNRHFPEYH